MKSVDVFNDLLSESEELLALLKGVATIEHTSILLTEGEQTAIREIIKKVETKTELLRSMKELNISKKQSIWKGSPPKECTGNCVMAGHLIGKCSTCGWEEQY